MSDLLRARHVSFTWLRRSFETLKACGGQISPEGFVFSSSGATAALDVAVFGCDVDGTSKNATVSTHLHSSILNIHTYRPKVMPRAP